MDKVELGVCTRRNGRKMNSSALIGRRDFCYQWTHIHIHFFLALDEVSMQIFSRIKAWSEANASFLSWPLYFTDLALGFPRRVSVLLPDSLRKCLVKFELEFLSSVREAQCEGNGFIIHTKLEYEYSMLLHNLSVL